MKKNRGANLWSLLGFLLFCLGFIGLLLSKSLLSWNPLVILLQVMAAGTILWARLTFGWRSFHIPASATQGGVVTSGPYRYVRHPIYGAGLVFLLAGAVSHFSVQSVAYVLAALTGYLLRISHEEASLSRTYPEYLRYVARTKRLIPWVY